MTIASASFAVALLAAGTITAAIKRRRNPDPKDEHRT